MSQVGGIPALVFPHTFACLYLKKTLNMNSFKYFFYLQIFTHSNPSMPIFKIWILEHISCNIVFVVKNQIKNVVLHQVHDKLEIELVPVWLLKPWRVPSSRLLWSWLGGCHTSSWRHPATWMCWACRKSGCPQRRSPRPRCASSQSPVGSRKEFNLEAASARSAWQEILSWRWRVAVIQSTAH